EADQATPSGYSADIDLDVTSNGGTYNNSFVMSFVIGQIPVLIVDLDGNYNSGPDMETAVQNNGVSAEYTTSFPGDLNVYSSIFVCLGIYSDNHVLSTGEGQALAGYLNGGGMLYMEGGDTWYYDDQTAVHGMFNINGTDDGSSDLGTINGQTGTFTDGMSFSYNGDNSWIDHMEPIGSAFTIFQNQSPSYGTGIAYEEGSYSTIGCSHEFGGLSDGSSPSTKDQLMLEYLVFFGILPDNIQADFNADDTEICIGESVQFSDNSFGNIVSWDWTFEGGTPASSSEQNPVVTYSGLGDFDVSLTVSDGTNSHSVTKSDFINVSDIPDVPATPTGPAMVAVDLEPTSDYSTTGATNANSYIWDLQPAAAGTIAGTGTTATVTWNWWEGIAEIRVKSVNGCGESNFSQAFQTECVISVGISENENVDKLRIIPNPNNGEFAISWSNGNYTNVDVEIADSKGNRVYFEHNIELSNGSAYLSPDNLQSGLYFITIKNTELNIIKKLIVR
ncbi:MAG: PKD domain-containing protein, partial [Bacteroidales bacterium]|nr:PKD domain-containing protein [Bacteroidales bacterium]